MKVQFEVSKTEIMRALILIGSKDEDTEKVMNEIEKIDVLEISDEVMKTLSKDNPAGAYLLPILAVSQISLNIDKE